MNPTVAVRLPPEVLAQVDRVAKDSGKKRSDIIRDLVTGAFKKGKK
jgi:metal-responsive CopG/Arc/MetJ family transcriptional regulator